MIALPTTKLSEGDTKHLAALDAARDEIIRRMGLLPEIIPQHQRPKFFEPGGAP